MHPLDSVATPAVIALTPMIDPSKQFEGGGYSEDYYYILAAKELLL